MFPFQQIPNSYLPLNLDLSSQPLSLSSFASKPELSNRISQMYYPDAQAYANIPSLLTKRPPSVELNNPPTKHIHQDNFTYQSDMLRMKELAKPHVASNSLEELNAQKLLMRSQPDLYGLTKAQALSGQQLSGLPNGISLQALQGLNLGQAEAQGYLSESPNTAYLKQLLELNGMNSRDVNAQLNAQMNELALQKQMANLYALQNGLQQQNTGLQDLASLVGLGGLGNIGNLGGLGNLAQIQGLNLGGLGGLGNLGQLNGLGGLGNLSSLQNLNNLNHSLTLELLNQSRNQQQHQQLLQLQQQQQQQQQQQPLGNVQSLASLQDMLKGGIDPRNLSMNDLLLLNSGLQNGMGGMGQLQAMNIPTSLAQLQQQQHQQQLQQTMSPISAAKNLNLPQNLLLQKSDSQQQRQQQQQQGTMVRRDSENFGMAQKQQQQQEAHNKRPIEIVEEGKSQGQGQVKPVVLVKPDNNKPKREIAENTAFRPRVVEQEKEREQMKPVDMKGKKIEISNNVMMHNHHHHHQHANNSQESAWDNSKDSVLERRKNRPLQLQTEQMEKNLNVSFVVKKPATPEYEKASQRQGSFSVSLDFEKKRQSQTPQANNKGINIENVNGRDLFNKKSSDKMLVEKEGKKSTSKPAQFGNGVSVSPYKANNKSNNNMVIENNNVGSYSQGQYGVGVGENDHSIMAKEHEGPQKIIITKRGPEHQASIPELILNDEDEEDFKRRKELKNVWDPLSVNPRDISNYVRELERVLGVKVISQEKALRLLIKKDMNFEKAIETAKLNERQYGSLLGISTNTRELRSKKIVDG